ncbi:MAG: DUF5329 domain-containing protein [Pseudomonadota bacterium]|nr:DUF5329 domain-containing protein [Pseudomonadota bacterium]
MTARPIRRTLLATTATLVLALCNAAAAAEPSQSKDEISHLLQYVAGSSCTFIRNGSDYAPDKARDHLASKYEFVGSRITTAEEFIKYLATQSSMSGEPYHVRCGKTELLSGAWLTDELNRYRRAPHLQASR